MIVRETVPPLTWQRFIERWYGFKIQEVQSCDSFYRSNAVQRIVTEKGIFAVKHYHGTEQNLSVLYRRFQMLIRKGYKDVPIWRKTTDDAAFVRWQGQLLYVIEWVEGRPFEYTTSSAFHLGESLRQLHLTTAKAGDVTVRGFLEQRRRQLSRALVVLRKHAQISASQRMESWYEIHRETCIRLLESSNQELIATLESKHFERNLCTLIHGDVTSPNIVVVNGKIRLIDWERLSTGLAMEELAKAISNTALFRIALISATLDGYQVQNLASFEKTLFRAFFRIPREALHMIDIVLKKGKRSNLKSLSEIVVQTWSDRMNAIRWVDENIR